MNSLALVALVYEEPDYEVTRKAIAATGLPVYWADRQGWGNFSEAMNRAFRQVVEDVVWFVTDVDFEPETPHRLLASLTNNNLVALHPEHASDHVTHTANGNQGIELVPFIEWTAPMVRSAWYRDLGGLDEDHWYRYMDLIFSKRVRDCGGLLGVDHDNRVRHVYRKYRELHEQHEITVRRYTHRDARDGMEREMLCAKFGPNWPMVLAP